MNTQAANPAITDEALWAITKNAVRHLVEANQHHNGGRFASALASAVYSIEETGKLSFLTTHGKSPKAKRHATHTMLFWALMKMATDWQCLW
jgi:AbiV family abortive infection protein